MKKSSKEQVAAKIKKLCQENVDYALNPDAMFSYINTEFGDDFGEVCMMIDPRYDDLLEEQFRRTISGQNARAEVEAIEKRLKGHVLKALAERLR